MHVYQSPAKSRKRVWRSLHALARARTLFCACMYLLHLNMSSLVGACAPVLFDYMSKCLYHARIVSVHCCESMSFDVSLWPGPGRVHTHPADPKGAHCPAVRISVCKLCTLCSVRAFQRPKLCIVCSIRASWPPVKSAAQWPTISQKQCSCAPSSLH